MNEGRYVEERREEGRRLSWMEGSVSEQKECVGGYKDKVSL